MNSDDARIQVFEQLLADATALTGDMAHEVELTLQEGLVRPLDEQGAERLLIKVAELVEQKALAAEDIDTAVAMSSGAFVEKVLAVRKQLLEQASSKSVSNGSVPQLKLKERNGIEPQQVFPRPTFHGREVPMNSGFVRVQDVALWDENERLDVHVRQFKQQKGRQPTGDEVLQIMLTEMPLPGVEGEDEFKIKDLARSIANNGVRRPPIVDLDGTLWDGNRRIAACQYILRSNEFEADQKRRAEWVFVWQFTEFATDEDRELVNVSLNFEPDYKQNWPQYVRARKVYDEWQRRLVLEPKSPSRARQIEIMREISNAFALGPHTTEVDRYIRMVDWANDFEGHQINDRRRDEYAVRHRAKEKFEYFDEFSKGARPGGVAYSLNQDEDLKALAFDLLFENKFKNFTQIRDLKHVPANGDVLDLLLSARKESDEETAKIKVDDALDLVKQRRAEKRRLGANARIEQFAEFIEDLPISSFRDQIKPANLERLLSAMSLARHQAINVLGASRVEEILGEDI